MSSSIQRLLASSAPDSESGGVSVLAVAIITLELVILFETMRRQLDVAVSGHQFFQAVVDLIYREITTLGVVEFFLYLLHKYYLDYSSEVEAGHRTDKSWVQTEEIDIGHYVAIRKEFDRLEKITLRLSDNVNEKQSSCWYSFQRAVHDLTFKIQHPHLTRRKNQLLVSIRFHELRAHLIDSNNLPPRFKVSHYLKRSLTSVLLDFVHISPGAWISVMATANLIHFGGGMLEVDRSEDDVEVERYLAYTCISMMLCFIVLAFVLYFQMKSIFSKILHMKLTVADSEEDVARTWRGFSVLSSSSTDPIDQLDLFWGRSPHLVIVIIQYMQFVFAFGRYTLCTSMGQLVNQERLHETLARLRLDDEIRKMKSLEEEKKAEEKISRRKRELEAKNAKAAAKAAQAMKASLILHSALSFFPHKTYSAEKVQILNAGTLFSGLFVPMGSGLRKSGLIREKSLSDGVLSMKTDISHMDLFRSGSNSPSGSTKQSTATALSMQNMEEDETHLRETLSLQSKQQRRCFRTSISDSVALMREAYTSHLDVLAEKPIILSNEDSMKSPAAPSMQSLNAPDVVNGHFESQKLCDELSDLSLEKRERKQRRRIMKTSSEGVPSMRLSMSNKPKMLSFDPDSEREPARLVTLLELTKMSATDLPEIPAFKRKVKSNRHQRKRSVSDGVALMRAGVASNRSSVAVTRAFTDDLATRNIDPNKDQQNYESGDKKSVNFISRLTFSSGQNFDAKEECIDTTTSVDGDDTDIDDVPEAMLKNTVAREGKIQAFVQSINLASFFQSSRYRIMSAFIGPLPCFFSVARVQAFNYYGDHGKNVWDNVMPFSFWLEVSLYCVMMAEMLLILAVFLTKKGRAGSFIHCSAAAFGIAINLMCLLLLLVAETKRCCPDDNITVLRLLATDTSEEHDELEDAHVECCPKFGQRTYGGFGKIEPFTALIWLTQFRFFVAWCIAKISGDRSIRGGVLPSGEETEVEQHGSDPTDKVRGLWLTAIGVHSETAKSCGLFSGELLQCMLGIYCDSNGSDDGKESVKCSTEDVRSPDVKNEVSDNEAYQHRGKENIPITFETSSRGPNDSLTTPTVNVNDSGVLFEYPKARLIRRMRRCQRRLLPFMDDWNVVDVVLTSHELVLFDVVDATDDLGLVSQDTIFSSTDGCKGLYLSEVAKGRKIVSQFNLDEIDFMDIEHRAPIPQEEIETDDVEATHNNNLLEYWQGGKSQFEDYEVVAMNRRWSHVPEDRLKIHFKYSTLFLRFFVDLKEREHTSKASNNNDDIGLTVADVGAEAKLWCRTIARLRGASNLRWQNLPHFGENGTDELEILDFVKYYDREHDDIQKSMKMHRAHHRRKSSIFR
ncbi:hypothetical protein ACHAW5_008670 [Stephanodiscus triporus]|uniref:Uncharacterized protein n=1 Tax=Stephanodiscus triporus TaxID=2934178 RepID=A0ABD3QPG2_9STRA